MKLFYTMMHSQKIIKIRLYINLSHIRLPMLCRLNFGVLLYDTVWSGSLGDCQPFGETNSFHLQREWSTTIQGVVTQQVTTWAVTVRKLQEVLVATLRRWTRDYGRWSVYLMWYRAKVARPARSNSITKHYNYRAQLPSMPCVVISP